MPKAAATTRVTTWTEIVTTVLPLNALHVDGSFAESKLMDDAITPQRTSRAVTSCRSRSSAASGKSESGGGR